MQPAPRRRFTLGAGSIAGFLFLLAAIYWAFVLLGVIPEHPKAIAATFLLILVVAGGQRLAADYV